MTQSTWPTTADAINDSNDPAIVTTQLADAINAIQTDLLAIGQTSPQKTALAVTTPAFVSGTGVKNTAGSARTYSIATATAGTATVAVSPDGTTYTALVTTRVTAATDLIVVPSVPNNWYVKVTLATSTGAANWVVY